MAVTHETNHGSVVEEFVTFIHSLDQLGWAIVAVRGVPTSYTIGTKRAVSCTSDGTSRGFNSVGVAGHILRATNDTWRAVGVVVNSLIRNQTPVSEALHDGIESCGKQGTQERTDPIDPVVTVIISGEGVDDAWAKGSSSIHGCSGPQESKQMAGKERHAETDWSEIVPAVMTTSEGRLAIGSCAGGGTVVVVREASGVPMLLGGKAQNGQGKGGGDEHFDEYASGAACASFEVCVDVEGTWKETMYQSSGSHGTEDLCNAIENKANRSYGSDQNERQRDVWVEHGAGTAEEEPCCCNKAEAHGCCNEEIVAN